ncbi:unnamed protein product [Clonostachys rosea]|uniref:Uncharacterized protein n=1 Tax=Bionectria ochroleuca TaxID=29856 RepID=A0ABY6TWV9_BIOOC|nr:unnamed protein product [Clonostachys rosea]
MPDTIIYAQPLIAAFAFGIIVNAALILSLGLITRHGASLFRDGVRLALFAFAVASGLWGLFGFVSMNVTSSSGCQASLAFAVAFDQVARISFEQFLLWKIIPSSTISFKSLIPQIILFIRLILAAVFVGFQRPQFVGVCIAQTLVLPLGITVICVDVLLLILFFAKLDWTGSARRELNGDWEIYRSRSIAASVAGFGIVSFFRDPLLIAPGDMAPEFLDGASAREHRVSAMIHSMPKGLLPISRWDKSMSISNNDEMKEKSVVVTRHAEVESSSSSFNVTGATELEARSWDIEKGPAGSHDARPRNFHSHSTHDLSISQASSSGTPNIKHKIPVVITTSPQIDDDVAFMSSISSEPAPTESKDARASWSALEFAVQDDLRQRSSSQPLYPPSLKGNMFPTPLNISRSKTVNERGRIMQKNIPVRPDTWDLLEVRGKRKRLAETNTTKPSEDIRRSTSPAARNIETLPSSLQPPENNINRHTCASSTFTAWPGNVPDDSVSPPSISMQYFTKGDEGSSEAQKVDQPLNDSSSKPLPPSPDQESSSIAHDNFQLQLNLATTTESDKLTFFSPGDVAQILSAANGREVYPPVSPLDESTHSLRVSETTNAIRDPNLHEYALPQQSESVVDRPRPIQRDITHVQALDLQRSKPSIQAVRRSHSCGSARSRRPTSSHANEAQKSTPTLLLKPSRESLQAHLHRTGSMTVEEKMGKFFQVPSCSQSLSVTEKRKSRSLPEVPDARMESGEIINQAATQRRRISQVRRDTSNIGHHQQDRNSYASRNKLVSRYSAYLSPKVEAPAASPQPSPSPQRTSEVPSTIRGAWKEDDITTNWGSIHSAVNGISLEPVKAVEVMHSARPSATPRFGDQEDFYGEAVAEDESTSSEEFYIADHSYELQHESEDSISERHIPRVTFPLWHYRVGDRCSTFTLRRQMPETRRAPPPSALDLTKPPKPLWIFAAEPSPLESPGHALEMLQEQLNKLEDDINSVSYTNQPDTGDEIDVSASRCDWQTMWNVVDVDSPSYSIAGSDFAETPEPLCIPSARSEKLDLEDNPRSSRLTVVPATNLPRGLSSHSPRITKTTSLTVYPVRPDQFSSPTPPDSDDSDSSVIEVPLVYADSDEGVKKPQPSRWTITAAPPNNGENQRVAPNRGKEKMYQIPMRKSMGVPSNGRVDLTHLERISTSYIPGDNLAL